MNSQPTIVDFAKAMSIEAHNGQFRKDGRPYITHPERVAALVRKYKGDSHEVLSLEAAAWGHDWIEDTTVTYYDIVAALGYCVASLIMELTTNPEMKNGVGSKKIYLAYKLKHMTHWALVLKLCDRLDNMSDTNGCSEEWIRKYVDETEFIIDYICKNRELTNTQRVIIKDLLCVVQDVKVRHKL